MASQRFRTSMLLSIWFATAVVYAQNTLQIQYPPAPPAPQIKDLYPKQFVKFTWTSSWPNTSLWIFQERSDGGNMAHNQLEIGPQVTEHAWSAHKIRKTMSRGDPFWLYLFNADDQDCQACTSNSTRFYIRDKENENALKIGLGVGLGVGIPLIVAVSCIAIWLRVRRRKNQQHGSQTMLLRDTSKEIGTSSLPASAAPTDGIAGSVEKNSPLESGGHDVVELPSHPKDARAEAPTTRERFELEGDHAIQRDMKDEVMEHESRI